MTSPIPVQIIRAVIRQHPTVLPHLSEQTRSALKAAPGYEGVRNAYWAAVYDSVHDYLVSDGPVTAFRNAMKTAAADAFIQAAEIAYQDGGAELPFDDDTLAWLGGEQEREFGFIDDLFSRLREEWEGIDPIHEAFARADGYANRLDAIYSEAKMRGSKNVMVTWHLGATKDHCTTCASLDGKRHKISWFVDRDYIPRKPGNGCECHGYNCDCSLVDDKGNEFTV